MSFFDAKYKQAEPIAREGTKFRIMGPFQVNGMNVWRIYTIVKGGRGSRRQVGPDHFTYGSAVDELKALVSGKRSFYFDNVGFEKHGI